MPRKSYENTFVNTWHERRPSAWHKYLGGWVEMGGSVRKKWIGWHKNMCVVGYTNIQWARQRRSKGGEDMFFFIQVRCRHAQ